MIEIGLSKMADHLHYSTREFRDILLAELSKLEYGIREHLFNTKGPVHALASASAPVLVQAPAQDNALTLKHDHEVKKLRKELAEYKELNEKLTQAASNSTIVNDLEKQVEDLNRQLKKAQQENKALQSTCMSKTEYEKMENAYQSLRSTCESLNETNESLKTSYSEAQERMKELEKENEGLKEELEVVKKLTAEKVKPGNKNIVITEPEAEEEEEIEAEVEEEEEELDPASFPDLKNKGKVYKQAPDNTLYLETEEGWEEVGVWDPKTKTITEAEAEEDEAEPNLTEFQYKGKIYFLDEENNVFEETDEGYEQVGKWNGKKITFE